MSHQPWTEFLSPPAFASLPLAPAGALLAALLDFRRRLAPPRSALAFADALENLREPKIDLALLHVDADDLDLHLVPETVALVRVLADQRVRALEEAVIVVGHRRHVDHAFDEMLD